MSTIDSGLGWSCDSDYYVSDANTLVGWGTQYDSQYYKTAAGGALAAKIRFDDGFNSAVLMSTVETYSHMTVSPTATATTYPYDLDGVTWYVTVPPYAVRDDGSPSDYPWICYDDPLDGNAGFAAQIGDIVEAMISEANVQYTVDRIPTTNWVKTFVEGVEAETATRVNALDTAKQPKTMSSAITVDGTSQTTVENAIGAINDFTSTKISDIYAILGTYGNDVFGLQVDYRNYTYTRLAGAAGKTQEQLAAIFPWSGIERINLADDGTVNAYYGDELYTENGSNGQCMTLWHKVYYRRVPIELDGKAILKENIYMSPTKYEGFKVLPCFLDENGDEKEFICISSYEGSIYDVSESSYLLNDEQVADFTAGTGDKLCSIAGAKPCSGLTQSLTRANAEQLARNRGDGWHTLDSKSLALMQWMFVVEYATFNSQVAIGKGVVDKAAGSGNESVITGATSSLGNASGMAEGTSGLVSVSLHGVENPWGNVWKFIPDENVIGDGTKRGGEIYICNSYDYFNFPRITSNSVDIRGEVGEVASVQVSAIGSITYQWQVSKDNGQTWTNSTATGADASIMYIDLTPVRWGYQYRCKITDIKGNVIHSGVCKLIEANTDKQLTGSVGGISEYTINSDYYKSVGFTLPNSSNYISAFGYSEEFDWLFMPTETSGTASSLYPVGDTSVIASDLSGTFGAAIGHAWSAGSSSGILSARYDLYYLRHNQTYSARLIYTGEVLFTEEYTEEENFEN